MPQMVFFYSFTGQLFIPFTGEPFDQGSLISEYKIVKEIGRGGFGAVMLAQHKVTGEKVALKFINANSYGGTFFITFLKTLRKCRYCKRNLERGGDD